MGKRLPEVDESQTTLVFYLIAHGLEAAKLANVREIKSQRTKKILFNK